MGLRCSTPPAWRSRTSRSAWRSSRRTVPGASVRTPPGSSRSPRRGKPMRKLVLLLAAMSIAAPVAAGCGNDETASSASALAPETAVIYGEATLKPEGEQKAALEAIVSKFPGQGSAGDRLKLLVDMALEHSDAGISYEEDLEPWLGDEAAFFVLGKNMDQNALLLAADDEDKAQDALEKSAEG